MPAPKPDPLTDSPPPESYAPCSTEAFPQLVRDLTWDGRGVLRTPEGKVLFIPGALPGDEVLVDDILDSVEQSAAIVSARRITPSPDRVEPPCSHHEQGCVNSPLGAWDYRAALAWKRRHLMQTLIRVGGFQIPPVVEILPSPLLWGYRNRLELHLFSLQDRLSIGYRTPQGFTPIQDCLLAKDTIRNHLIQMIPALKEVIYKEGIDKTLRSRKNKKSAPRLLIRDNGRGNCVAVLFVEESQKELVSSFRKVASNTNLAGWQIRQTSRTASRYLTSGIIEEEGDGLIDIPITPHCSIKGSPLVFTQVNEAAAELLIRKVLEFLPQTGTVLDLYGGYGAFALPYYLAGRGGAAVVDLSSPSIAAGRSVAEQAGLEVDYLCQDLSQISTP